MKRKKSKNKPVSRQLSVIVIISIIISVILYSIINAFLPKPDENKICLLGDSTMFGEHIAETIKHDQKKNTIVINKAKVSSYVEDIPTVIGYRIVFVLSGINNIYRGDKPEDILAKMQSLEKRLSIGNKHIIFITPLPNKEYRHSNAKTQAKLVRLNKLMQDSKLNTRNFNHYFGGQTLREDLDAGDGLHLSVFGQYALGYILSITINTF